VLVFKNKGVRMKACTACGFEGPDSEFRKNRKICKKCHSEYNKKYREKNRESLKQKHKEYWQKQGKEKRRESVRNAEERTIESFLAVQARSVKHRCIYLNKRSYAKYDECDFDSQFLIDLWYSNDGKCAITGLQMNHKTGNLYTVSVDRIDSTKSYTKDNVQLICKGINFLKNKHTQDETIDFLNQYYETRKQQDSI
jgi:hypothetical protein